MSEQSGQPVIVDDVDPPMTPSSSLTELIEYLEGSYSKRRADFNKQLLTCRSLRNKEDVIHLGYDALLFRMELDSWLALAGQMLDQERGNQLSMAHEERTAEVKESGRKRPDATVVKTQAEQFIAPLKRAFKELQDTQDLLGKTLSWCQSQQKILAADEYGDLFSANNEPPTQPLNSPPSVAKELQTEFSD